MLLFSVIKMLKHSAQIGEECFLYLCEQKFDKYVIMQMQRQERRSHGKNIYRH